MCHQHIFQKIDVQPHTSAGPVIYMVIYFFAQALCLFDPNATIWYQCSDDWNAKHGIGKSTYNDTSRFK